MDAGTVRERIQELERIIGTDAGGRGMQHLMVPGDLFAAATCFHAHNNGTLVLLSGFPCCVDAHPPTETDGPPGTMALARAGVALGYRRVVVVTDECNRAGFEAAVRSVPTGVELETFANVWTVDDEDRFHALARACTMLIACERAGPSQDGNCYTMRGIDMTGRGLIAPLHRFVTECQSNKVPFIAIGDGGNELGMGKVISAIRQHIDRGDRIGCVVAADHLIAASVSNWGGYALAAAAALVRAQDNDNTATGCLEPWVHQCVPTDDEERALLDRCVAAGCRDGVSGKLEATVDGMPLETSLQCLRDIRAAVLGTNT